MRPFIINDTIRQKIAELVTFAEANVVTDLENRKEPVGHIKEYCLEIPMGYRVVYSIDQQKKGLMRHLSMSVDNPGKLPSVAVVEQVCKLIGFKSELQDCYLDFEDCGGGHVAINVLEYV